MKIRVFAILVLVSCVGTLAVGQRVVNPAGLSTVPQSSIQSGLVESPSPLDTSGNLIITGNVRGGKHFRGVVPYRSSTSFAGSLGSARLDSFLRDSAGSESFGRYARRPQAFYSPSGTVRRISGRQPGVFETGRSQSEIGRVTDGWRSGALSYERSLLADSLLYEAGRQTLRRFRLNPVSPLERPSRVLPELVDLARDRELLAVIPERARKRAYERLWAEDAGRSDVGTKPVGREGLERVEGVERYVEGLERVVPGKSYVEELTWGRAELFGEGVTEGSDSVQLGKESERLGVSLQRRRETGSEDLAPELGVEDLEGRADSEEGRSVVWPDTEEKGSRSGLKAGAWQAEESGSSVLPEEGLSGEKSMGSGTEGDTGTRRMSGGSGVLGVGDGRSEQVRRRVEAITRPYGGVRNYFEAKFKEYISAADTYMQQGKYYRAADAYTLASVYKAGSPVAEAGKSHALLAAGEYMSSSLFLSRAFDRFAESEVSAGERAEEGNGSRALLLFSSGFSLIDRDTLEKRASDIEAWYGRTGSAELQFLLSYVYYQMGRYERAREAIEAAYGEMADVEAVKVLKKAIESGPAE